MKENVHQNLQKDGSVCARAVTDSNQSRNKRRTHENTAALWRAEEEEKNLKKHVKLLLFCEATLSVKLRNLIAKDEKQASGPQMNVMSRKSEMHNKLSSKGQHVGKICFQSHMLSTFWVLWYILKHEHIMFSSSLRARCCCTAVSQGRSLSAPA